MSETLLLVSVAAIVAIAVVWLVRRNPDPARDVRPIDQTYPHGGFPISNPDPGGPIPGETTWPTFERPYILGDILPFTPKCELTYPLIYTQLSQYLGSCENAGGVVDGMKPDLLDKARTQAARYCIRQSDEDCQGVQELDHSFSDSCFQVDENTYVAVTITYLFKCTDPGPPVVYTPDNPPPSSGPPTPPKPEQTPDCGGTYHYVAHDISEIIRCDLPGRAAIEQQKAQRLIEAARDHAATFCQGAPDPLCRLHAEYGYDVTHHCFRSGPLNTAYHTSSIVYFFRVPDDGLGV